MSWGVGALTMIGAATVFTPSAEALMLNKWQYSMDSDNDSSGLIPSGQIGFGSETNFETYGLATQISDEGKVRIAIQSNLGLGGAESRFAEDGRIHWGDMIINVACDALNQVGGESLFGIRFEGANESGVVQVGVYGDVELFERAAANGNYSDNPEVPLNNYGDHNRFVQNGGGNPEIGTLPDNYFDESTHVPSLIRSGTYLGAVEIITDTSDWELDGFTGLGGQLTAFEFDANLLPLTPGQSVCIHIAPECNNDIHGGKFIYEVPTPAAVLPILSGLFASAKRKRQDVVDAE